MGCHGSEEIECRKRMWSFLKRGTLIFVMQMRTQVEVGGNRSSRTHKIRSFINVNRLPAFFNNAL